MTTLDTPNPRMRNGIRMLAIASFCLVGPAVWNARAETPPLQIIPLAQGFSPDHHIELHVKGPNDVLQAQLVFEPLGDTGWHTHPGPVIVVVKTGALTEYHANGCRTVHPQGSVFFETAGEVHRAVNETGGVVEVFATFLSPAGSQPLEPVPAPVAVCRQ